VATIGFARDRNAGLTEPGRYEDYVTFYAAGTLVIEGRGGELYDLEALQRAEEAALGRPVGEEGGVLPFFNPPFVAALFAPLALLPIASAVFVLMAVNLALVIAAALTIGRVVRFERREDGLLLWLGLLTLGPVNTLILHGQLSALTLLGWALFVSLQVSGRPGWSGAALALLLVKPQAALVAALLLIYKRQWRPLAALSAIAAVLVAVSVAVAGPASLTAYPDLLLASTGWHDELGVHVGFMYGWNGLVSEVLSPASTGFPLVVLALDCGTLGALALALRGPWQPRSPDFLLVLAATVAAATLLNPHLYLHDTLPVALAFVLALQCVRSTGRRPAYWLAVAPLAWLAMRYATRLRYDLDLNVVTPLIIGLLVITGALLIGSRRTAGRARTATAVTEETRAVAA
jgi:hypothetical protein